jgi:hypothetical protein
MSQIIVRRQLIGWWYDSELDHEGLGNDKDDELECERKA